MVYTELSERKKSKPRGRPFEKGNKRGKLDDEILASPGHKKSIKGGTLIPVKELDTLTIPIEAMATPCILEETIETKKEAISKNSKDLEIIESIDFKNGENTLSIRFSKKHNRMFRIQVILNGENEIRPVTYTGSSTGISFWNFLKKALVK